MSNKVIAWIKTVVPGAWGALVAYVFTQLALPDALQAYLTDPITITLVVGASVALWKLVWDAADDHIPNWMSQIVLGSAQQAIYLNNLQPTVDAIVAGVSRTVTVESEEGPAN